MLYSTEGLYPCAFFALLPNKRQVTYDRLSGEVMQQMLAHIPTDFLMDFEKAAMNNVVNAFIGVITIGCFFHLSSNLLMKIQDNGLKQLYENDQGISTFMRMIASVAFAPILDVPQTFYDVEASIRRNYHQNGVDVVIDYFEDTYIGRQLQGRPRDIPMFPMEIWNMFGSTVGQLPKTNNHVEEWHKRFQTTCGCAHLNIWKFIKLLQNEESLIHAEIQQALGGHPTPPPKWVVHQEWET